MKDMEKDFESDIDRVMNTVCVVVLALAVGPGRQRRRHGRGNGPAGPRQDR